MTLDRPSRSRRMPGTTSRARSLRRDDNCAEAVLWNELKDRRLGGFKFARQVPVGRYFADFVCREMRRAVEIDVSQHADLQYDRERDAYMRSQSLSVIRFWNTDVLKNTRSVCETILGALDGGLAEDVVAGDLRFVMAKSKD